VLRPRNRACGGNGARLDRSVPEVRAPRPGPADGRAIDQDADAERSRGGRAGHRTSPRPPRHASLAFDFVDVFTWRSASTFLGHYIDRLFARSARDPHRRGTLVRGLGWFAGGLWCYVIARWLWTHYGRDLGELPGMIWGGLFLVIFNTVCPTPRRYAISVTNVVS